MSKEWTEQVAAAEAVAQQKQAAEALAESRFDAVHAQPQEGRKPTDTEEFHAWMNARRETDAAWGAWAVVMDARPGA